MSPEPPTFLRYRAFQAFKNVLEAEPCMAVFADLEGLLRLLDSGLAATYGSPPHHWFPNNFAATGLFTRAYQGLQAAANLCALGFYVEAKATLRGVYESAGLARTLAHKPDLAERWLHQNEWFKDNVSRQFVQGASQQRVPHSDLYRHMSQHAHPKAVSTFDFVFTRDLEYRPSPYPDFDAESFEECARYITAVALFVAWAFRNAAAHVDNIPSWWRQQLTELSEKITGEPHNHLDKDWDAQQKRYETLAAQVRHADELDDALDADPNSTRNKLRRLAADSDSADG